MPKVLPKHVAPVVDAEPHFPLVLTGVQVPKLGWQRFETAQNAGVLPQFPFTEQQDPNELPVQVAPVVEAEPHFPSRLTGVAVGIELEDFVEVVELAIVVDDEEPGLHWPYFGWLYNELVFFCSARKCK